MAPSETEPGAVDQMPLFEEKGLLDRCRPNPRPQIIRADSRTLH